MLSYENTSARLWLCGKLKFPGVVEMQGMIICRDALSFGLGFFSGSGPAPS